jgi:hypothetical protein
MEPFAVAWEHFNHGCGVRGDKIVAQGMFEHQPQGLEKGIRGKRVFASGHRGGPECDAARSGHRVCRPHSGSDRTVQAHSDGSFVSTRPKAENPPMRSNPKSSTACSPDPAPWGLWALPLVSQWRVEGW